MNLITGTVNTFDGVPYAAKVAFNTKFVEYLKENADSEAELLLNPKNENQEFYSNASVFVLTESYLSVKATSVLDYKKILDFTVEKIDHINVTQYPTSISAENIVYISNRPLFSSSAKRADDDSDVSGGVDAGTFILVSTSKMGLVLYWTSVDYEDVLDTLISVVIVASANTTIDAKANTTYIVTTPGTGSRNFKLPDAATYKGATITAVMNTASVVSLTVIPSGTDKINNGVGTDLDSPYNRITVFSTGIEWVILELFVA